MVLPYGHAVHVAGCGSVIAVSLSYKIGGDDAPHKPKWATRNVLEEDYDGPERTYAYDEVCSDSDDSFEDGCSNDEGEIAVYDSKTFQLLRVLGRECNPVGRFGFYRASYTCYYKCGIDFTADGLLVVADGRNGALHLLDVHKGCHVGFCNDMGKTNPLQYRRPAAVACMPGLVACGDVFDVSIFQGSGVHWRLVRKFQPCGLSSFRDIVWMKQPRGGLPQLVIVADSQLAVYDADGKPGGCFGADVMSWGRSHQFPYQCTNLMKWGTGVLACTSKELPRNLSCLTFHVVDRRRPTHKFDVTSEAVRRVVPDKPHTYNPAFMATAANRGLFYRAGRQVVHVLDAISVSRFAWLALASSLPQ